MRLFYLSKRQNMEGQTSQPQNLHDISSDYWSFGSRGTDLVGLLLYQPSKTQKPSSPLQIVRGWPRWTKQQRCWRKTTGGSYWDEGESPEDKRQVRKAWVERGHRCSRGFAWYWVIISNFVGLASRWAEKREGRYLYMEVVLFKTNFHFFYG